MPSADDSARPSADAAVRLDVRPLLARGRDPLAVILDHAARVPPGGWLVIDAPFDPIPLRSLLGDAGFTAEARQPAPGHWVVRFRRAAPS